MFLKNQLNIYSSSIYFYYHLKFLALLPHSVNEKLSNGSFSIKIRDKIFTIFVLSATVAMSIAVKRQDHITSFVLSRIWDVNSHTGRATILFLICYQYRKSDKILDILRGLNEFDEKVSYWIYFTNPPRKISGKLFFFLESFS